MGNRRVEAITMPIPIQEPKSTSLSIMFKGIMQTNKTTKGIIKTGVSPQSYDDQWHLH